MYSINAPYIHFAQAVTTGRRTVGFTNQRELATLLGVKQQSVSRWEAGTHRPRLEQIGELASALRLDAGDLARLAGYVPPPSVVTLQPFPVEHLDPATFEYFIADLFKRLHPDAEVRRAGSSGHAQAGLDIEAVLADGAVVALQCKRVATFGPREVIKAVSAFTAEADQKILVLSRVASPQAAEAIRKSPGWSLWDSDDISRRIRSLSMHDQEKLVDLYWPGQRRALLGRGEPGPWLAPEDFFKPFEGRDRPFSHSWNLHGREEDQAAVVEAMKSSRALVLLTGPGGFGKSRLLKAVAEQIGATEPGTKVLFLSTTAACSARAMEDLGPGAKLLIVDDAHDRDGLGVLFDFAADPAHQVRLLLATRPYARARILGEAAIRGLADVPLITLERLTKAQLLDLARQVLETFKAPREWAEPIVRASGDSPLFVAMVSRIIARDRISLEIARADEELGRFIQGKFAAVMQGAFANQGSEQVHRAVLEVLAVVQPFNLEDTQLRDLIAEVHKLSEDQVSSTLKALLDGGVVFRRGAACRLMPDVLGDYFIEHACLDTDKSLSPYARRLLKALPAGLLKNALVNLGRLDWRLSDGDTADSPLLAEVWRSFENIDSDHDPRLDAIKAAALYQPGQALTLVERLAQRGRRLAAFDDIARSIAHSGSRFGDVLALLWELTRQGRTGRRQGDPAKVLVELGEINRRNPMEFVEGVANFALRLSLDPQNWSAPPTPLTLLRPVLDVEGVHMEAVGHQVSMSPYFINYDVVEPIRRTAIRRALELLHHNDPRIAVDAGNLFAAALKSPIGALNSSAPAALHTALEKEFVQTLKGLEKALQRGLHPLAAFAVARSIHWHAQHGGKATRQAAGSVMAALPTDTRFRTLSTLSDGWGRTFVPYKRAGGWQARLTAWQADIAIAIGIERPQPRERLLYMQAVMEELAQAGLAIDGAHLLFGALVEADLSFAMALLDDALSDPSSRTARYAQVALARLCRTEPVEGRLLAQRMIDSQNETLLAAVGPACGGPGRAPTNDDIALLRQVLASPHPGVVSEAVTALIHWPELDPKIRLDLLLGVHVGDRAKLAADIATVLLSEDGGAGTDASLWHLIGPTEVVHLLALLEPVPVLDDFWIDELLAGCSRHFPEATADFFMQRMERAVRTNSFGFRVANEGSHRQQRLHFKDTPAGMATLARVWRWLEHNRDRGLIFDEAARGLFKAMFAFDDEALAGFFAPLLSGGDTASLRQIGNLLSQANHTFVFDQADFVLSYLRRCQTAGPEVLDDAISQLFASVVSGMRTGAAGAPMPRDLEDVAQAKIILAKLSRLDPGYRLYAAIQASAQRDIDEAIKAAAMLEEGD